MNYFLAGLLVVSYVLFCLWCWRRYQQRQPAPSIASGQCVIGYASQGGNALRIAQQTQQQLQQAGLAAVLLPLNQIRSAQLLQASTLLLVASTYGEGEAPDNGSRFVANALAPLGNRSLAHLQVALLALGDSTYQHYCGFGLALQHELHQRGAQLLGDAIEVDRLDASALRHWQYYLGQISGNSQFSDWSSPSYSDWLLVQRRCINPGSLGAPVFHVQLQPLAGALAMDSWQAGDIAEIGPGNSAARIAAFVRQFPQMRAQAAQLLTRDLRAGEQQLVAWQALAADALLQQLPELPHREYSIASVPAEGSLDLLVRQQRDAQDHLGLGSGWLSEHAPLHQPLRLRIRTNPQFQAPADDCPLILIGNGTGIAGLRAHLAACAQRLRPGCHWLLFGERSAARDNFFAADIQRWQQQGLLGRCDLVFSRDAQPGAPRYVQDLLLLQAQLLEQWLARGAAIYVCGSLKGMAQGVDDALRQIIGSAALEQLSELGRYRRDVY